MKPTKEKKIRLYILQLIGMVKNLPLNDALGQRLGFGLIFVLVVSMVALILILSRIVGGGSITYIAKGSPGPVTFSHFSHTKGEKARYGCEDCHDQPFRADIRSGFIMELLKDSDRVVRIGKDTHRVIVGPLDTEIAGTRIIEVKRAERLCANDTCHDGKESFSRIECLKCHMRR